MFDVRVNAARKTDLAKRGRVNPRNFAAMNDSTVIAMAVLHFKRPFARKAEAVACLKTLPIEAQHALNKTVAQAYAKRLQCLMIAGVGQPQG